MNRQVYVPGAIVACLVALAWLLPVGRPAWSAGAAAEPVVLRIGVATDVLLDVSRKDAQAAFDVWAQQLGRERGDNSETRSFFLEDPDAVATAIRRNEVDLVLLPTLDFLRLQRQQAPIEPVRVGIGARTSLDVEVLLVHRDTLPRGLRGLTGQRLMVQPGAVGSLSRLWLDTLLAKEGLPDSGQGFGQIRQGLRASQVVLPVFFRQAEAALVKEASFATVGEMNPQVARDVVALARSPGLVHGVVCFNRQIAAESRRLLMTGLEQMSTSAAGRQILTLFRINQLPPYDTSQVANVVEMLRQRETLAKPSGR
jgi:ABC-type phosphate/phosphonate transport system substrate-binding protein